MDEAVTSKVIKVPGLMEHLPVDVQTENRQGTISVDALKQKKERKRILGKYLKIWETRKNQACKNMRCSRR